MNGDFVARMRGLPWQATEEDIKKFFSESKVADNGVVMALNFQGRPTGEAYVRFPSEEDLCRALDKHKEDMGHRYIEVFRSSIDEMEKAKVRSGITGGDEERQIKGVIRMRGLPYSTTAEDVLDFFDGIEVASQAVHFVTTPDGRATGEAYVEFTSEEDANRAMERHKGRLGTRYVELFRSSKHELLSVLSHQQQFSRIGGAGYYGGTYPYFTGGLNNQQQQQQQYGGSGRVVGGGVGVSAAHSSLGVLLGLGGIGVGSQGVASDSYGGGDGDNVIRMRGLPYSATEGDVGAWFHSVGVTPKLIHIVFNSNNRPSGEAFVEFNNPEDCQLAMTKHRDPMGSRYVELFLSSRQELSSLGVPAASYTPAPLDPSLLLQLTGVLQSAHAHPSLIQSQLDIMMGWGLSPTDLTHPQTTGWNPRSQSKDQGLTIRMRGLPYRANVQDILEFFRGYQVLPDSIQFGQEGDGRPSGECWVTFRVRNVSPLPSLLT